MQATHGGSGAGVGPGPSSEAEAGRGLPAGHQQVVCCGCNILLMYPNGASHVRCPRCQQITSAGSMTQIRCGSCAIVLMYPRGAASVQCAVCSHLNHITREALATLQCRGCSQTLQYAAGASCVKCAVCQVITMVAAAGPSQGPGASFPDYTSSTSGDAPAAKGMVVVEHPPTLDEDGNEVTNISVGAKLD